GRLGPLSPGIGEGRQPDRLFFGSDGGRVSGYRPVLHVEPPQISARASQLVAFVRLPAALRPRIRPRDENDLPALSASGSLAFRRDRPGVSHPVRLDHILRHDVPRSLYSNALLTRLGLHHRSHIYRDLFFYASRGVDLATAGPTRRGDRGRGPRLLHPFLRGAPRASSRNLAPAGSATRRLRRRRAAAVSLSVSLARPLRAAGRSSRGVLRYRPVRPPGAARPAASREVLAALLEPRRLLPAARKVSHSRFSSAPPNEATPRLPPPAGCRGVSGVRPVSPGDLASGAGRGSGHHLGGSAFPSLVRRPVGTRPARRDPAGALRLPHPRGLFRPGHRAQLRYRLGSPLC